VTDRFNDHAHVAVPTQRRLPAVRIGATSAVWIIAMSTFQTGVVLAQGMAVGPLIAAAAIGMVFLAAIGFALGWVGATTGLSTAMLIRRCFGDRGGPVVGVLLALVLGLGWHAWQLAFFGTTLHAYLPDSALGHPVVAMLLAASITTVSVMFGFRLLSLISLVAVPAVALLSIYALWLASGAPASPTPVAPQLAFADAIGLVVGNGIVGTIFFPDLARFAREPLRGAAAAAVGYALVGFFVLAAGAMIVTAAPGAGSDLPLAMRQLGIGWGGFVILVIAQWATNKGNLYSGALSLAGATGMRQSSAVIALGAAGFVIALAGIQDIFVPALLFLGSFVPALAAVIWTGRVENHDRPGPLWCAAFVLLGGAASYFTTVFPRPITSLIVSAVAMGIYAKLGLGYRRCG
jgi:cytosine permease